MGDRIASLPKDVRSLLRTGVAITTVAQCVEELVTNALDAGATCLAIRVDLSCFKIQVVDNGKGVKFEDLALIGERYATSKCHEVSDLENLCYFGYRGEAIASIRDISNIVEINTRSNSSSQTYCKIFQQGKALPVSESTLPRSCPGTTVTVHNLFYNLPVRKKCCNPTLDFEKIRQKVEIIALIKPSVSFTLRNDLTGHVVLQTHKTNSVLNTFNYLFSPGRGAGLTEVNGEEGDFKVNGYISKKGSNKKDNQFIYINGRNVLKTKLHKIVNHQLSKSLILRKKLELTSNKFRGHVMNTSPTKTTDQHAVYILDISCPYKEYDITFEPAKTLVEFKNFDGLQQCLEKIINKFLREHSLHLGILVEDFQKKSRCNGEEDNDTDDSQEPSTSGLKNIGLKPKCDIKTMDRDGLFSKVVKRKIMQDSTPESVESTDFECINDKNKSPDVVENSMSKGGNCFTPADQYLKAKTPLTPKLNRCQTDIKTTTLRSVDSDNNQSSYSKGKNYEFQKDTDGEMSEDPLPSQQKSKSSSSVKKTMIRLDTPMVREAKINVSSLSKLRKRRNFEEYPSSPKSPKSHDRLIAFTKLRESLNSSDIREKKMTNGKKNELPQYENSSQTCSKSPVKLYVSSLQKLRNLRRSGESSKHLNEALQPNRNYLQEVRRLSTSTSTVCENENNKLSASCDNQCSTAVLTHNELAVKKNNLSTSCDNQCSTAVLTPEKLAVDRENGVRTKTLDDLNSVMTSSIAETDSENHENLQSFHSDQTKGKSCAVTDMDNTVSDSGNRFASGVPIAAENKFDSGEESSINIDSDCEFKNDTPSPIDIDEACDAIDNCVAEIESIIASKGASNDNLLSTNTSISDVGGGILGATGRSDIHNKNLTTSENLIYTAQPIQDSHIGQSYLETVNKSRVHLLNNPENENLIEKTCHDSKQQRYTIEDTIKAVTEKSKDSSSEVYLESVMMNSPTINNTELSNDNIDIPYHSNFMEKMYTIPRDDEKLTSSQLNNEMTFMTYFDVNETQSIKFTMEAPCLRQRNSGKKLPFDFYMEHTGRTIITTSDSEVDESLICTESITDMDDSEPLYSHMQEFSLSRDSGLLVDFQDMDATDLDIFDGSKVSIPEFFPRSVSPCLSEGFCPEIESEGFSPAIDDGGLSSIETSSNSLQNDSQTYRGFGIHKSQSLSQKLKISMESDYHKGSNSYYCTTNTCTSNLTSRTCSKLTEQNEEEILDETKAPDSSESYDNSADPYSDSQIFQCKDCVGNFDEANIKKSLTKEKTVIDDHCHVSFIEKEIGPVSVTQESLSTFSEVSGSKSMERYEVIQECIDVSPSTPKSNIANEMNTDVFSPEGDVILAENGSLPNNGISCVKSIGSSDECFSPDGDSQLRSVQMECKTWIQVKDPKSGELLYVNTRSGHSINSVEFSPPEDLELDSRKDVTELNTPVNTGKRVPPLSPDSSLSMRLMLEEQLSKDEDDLSSVKWKEKINSTQKVEDLFKDWENPVFAMPHKSLPTAQINLVSRASSRAYKALNPCVFDKEMLQNFKVLGQVDNKFIACSLQADDGKKGEDLLVLIDQHAAHERVRLEKLTEEVYEVQNDNKVISCTDLVKHEEIDLPEDIVRVITSFTEEFQRIGVKFNWTKQIRDKVTLQSVPSCFVPREVSDVKRKKDTAAIKSTKILIKEYTEVLQDTGGSSGRLPSTIHKVLCSQACHGAIKFGDPLSLGECEDLLRDLAKCKLPFQCAHGRPSVVPLIQLAGNKDHKKRPNLWKIAKNLQR